MAVRLNVLSSIIKPNHGRSPASQIAQTRRVRRSVSLHELPFSRPRLRHHWTSKLHRGGRCSIADDIKDSFVILASQSRSGAELETITNYVE